MTEEPIKVTVAVKAKGKAAAVFDSPPASPRAPRTPTPAAAPSRSAEKKPQKPAAPATRAIPLPGGAQRRSAVEQMLARRSARPPADAPFSAHLSGLPDATSLDAYKSVPIDGFGAAMLRGMGWDGNE